MRVRIGLTRRISHNSQLEIVTVVCCFLKANKRRKPSDIGSQEHFAFPLTTPCCFLYVSDLIRVDLVQIDPKCWFMPV